MSDELLRAAQGRALARRRALAALDRAGFVECLAPAGALPAALLELVPRSAPLPQRLAVATGGEVVALVLHDGRSRALESELVAVAHEALAQAGAGSMALTLRSLEPAKALLAAHAVDAEASARLLEDPRSVPEAARSDGHRGAPSGRPETELPGAETAAPEQLERVLLAFLGRLRFKTYGTRSPEEVAARLASRLTRTLPAVAKRIQAARAGLIELAALDGRPAPVLAGATAVLGEHGRAVEPLRAMIDELGRLGAPLARVSLAGPPGALDPSWTLEALGAGVLASGGSFEWKGQRGALARLELGALPAGDAAARTDLLVIPVSDAELAAAQAFALDARRDGLRAELDPSGRNLRSALRAASRRGVPFAAILGAREVEDGVVQLKDLRREEQRTVARSEAPARVRDALSANGADPGGSRTAAPQRRGACIPRVEQGGPRGAEPPVNGGADPGGSRTAAPQRRGACIPGVEQGGPRGAEPPVNGAAS